MKSNWRTEFYCFSSFLGFPNCFQISDNSCGISSAFQKAVNCIRSCWKSRFNTCGPDYYWVGTVRPGTVCTVYCVVGPVQIWCEYPTSSTGSCSSFEPTKNNWQHLVRIKWNKTKGTTDKCWLFYKKSNGKLYLTLFAY